MPPSQEKVLKWTPSERNVIVNYWIDKCPLKQDDFKKLEAVLPHRTAHQISDQYRRIVKPDTSHLYLSDTTPSSSNSAPTTPSKANKRSRSEES